MLTKEISEVEKGFRKLSLSIRPTEKEVETMSEYTWLTTIYPRKIYEETLKSAQAKFDKFINKLNNIFPPKDYDMSYPTEEENKAYNDALKDMRLEIKRIIDELSSKQEGK
jgi:hypothetical protein